MKNIRYSMFAAAAALAIALPLAAQASDGTITFDGSISSQTCTINGGASPQNFTVHLPQGLAASTLNNGTNVAGKTQFTIALTNCTTASGSATTFFEGGATVDSVTNQLKNATGTGYASNVQVQLLDGVTDQKILVGSPVDPLSNNTQGTTWVPISTSGAATLTYYAQYYATGTVGPGLVNTSVVYDVIYM